MFLGNVSFLKIIIAVTKQVFSEDFSRTGYCFTSMS